jgi:hypothetical protein
MYPLVLGDKGACGAQKVAALWEAQAGSGCGAAAQQAAGEVGGVTRERLAAAYDFSQAATCENGEEGGDEGLPDAPWAQCARCLGASWREAPRGGCHASSQQRAEIVDKQQQQHGGWISGTASKKRGGAAAAAARGRAGGGGGRPEGARAIKLCATGNNPYPNPDLLGS